MKITREQLKQLIAETIREEQGVLLEMEPMSGAYEHPGDRAGPGAERPQHDGRDRHREETEDLLRILQDLYHQTFLFSLLLIINALQFYMVALQ